MKGETATREAILKAAVRRFAEAGFDGTTVRDICKEAEVNVALLNYHWGSKESLWLAVCEQVVENLLSQVRASLVPQAPFRENLHAVLSALFEEAIQDPAPFRIEVWNAMQSDSLDTDRVREKYEPLVQFSMNYMKERQKEGAVPTGVDVEASLSLLFKMFVYTIIGQPAHRHYFGMDITNRRHATRLKKVILRTADLLFGLSPESVR